MFETIVLGAGPDDMEHAVDLLRSGERVAIPTETVYGLAADARSAAAVAGIFRDKGRPSFNPLIAHVANAELAHALGEFRPEASALAHAFWPGPLTLVVPARVNSGIAPAVTAGLPTLAIRVPSHPVANEILSRFGGPLAIPSANPSGQISPTSPAHVLQGLGGRIAAVVDGGHCSVGVESTIIEVETDGTLRLLRAGSIDAETVQSATGLTLSPARKDAGIQAPGQMSSHYAPSAAMRLNAHEQRSSEVLLGFGRNAQSAALNLSPSGDLSEAAANLFAMLHQLDHAGAQIIAVSPIPDVGIGRAINDRLVRAAAPRSHDTTKYPSCRPPGRTNAIRRGSRSHGLRAC